MIASTSSSASFGALGSYLGSGKGGVPAEERVAWVESRGVVRDVDGRANPERAARVMEATADRTPQCTEPCYHVSISFDRRDLPGGPTDPASKELMLGVADDTLRDLGLDEHQVVVVAHGDRGHPHVHLMVNRVHPETGRTWDRWQDRVRLEKSLRAQERARGFREVPGQLGRLEGQERPARSPSRGAYRAAEREAATQGRRSLQHEARARVGGDFERAKTWEELEGRLASDGYVLRAKGRGLVLRDGDGREVKASAVSRAGGRGRLEKRLGASWREHRAAVEARTGPVPSGLSPHGQAVVRAHRDLEAAREHRAAVTAARERLGAAERSVSGLPAQEREVRAAWARVQRGLAGVYQDPAGAERLFVALEPDRGHGPGGRGARAATGAVRGVEAGGAPDAGDRDAADRRPGAGGGDGDRAGRGPLRRPSEGVGGRARAGAARATGGEGGAPSGRGACQDAAGESRRPSGGWRGWRWRWAGASGRRWSAWRRKRRRRWNRWSRRRSSASWTGA